MKLNGQLVRTASLESLVTISGGGTPSKSVPEYFRGTIPWVTPKDMKSWFIDDAEDHITEKAISESSTNIVEPGAVLVCIRSGVLAHTLPVAINRVSVTLNQDMKALRCKSDLNASYLARFLKWYSPEVLRTVRGTTAHNLSMDVMKQIEIPLPPLSEQKRIAEILDKADALCQKRREAVKLAAALQRSAFLDLFGDPAANEKQWPIVEFSHTWSGGLRNGISPSSRGKHEGRVLVLSSITGLAFDESAVKTGTFDEPFDDDQLVNSDEFLICRGNGNLRLVGAGRFPSRSLDDTVFPDTMIAARLNRKVIDPAYLAEVWSSRSIRSQIERGARTTNGTHKINQQVLAQITFPLPPLSVQHEYARVATAITGVTDRYERLFTDRLFNSLVQRAFQGDL